MDGWGTPVRCNHGNHTDQSDFEVGKTPNLDLLGTIRYHGHVRSIHGVHLTGVTKAPIPTNQISRLGKQLILTFCGPLGMMVM